MKTVRYTLWLEQDVNDEEAASVTRAAIYALPGYVEHSFEDWEDA